MVAPQAHGAANTLVGATLHDVTATGLRWAQAARAAGGALNSQIHALGDGAPWILIAEQARRQFRQQGRSTVDLFHVCEYLATAAPEPAHTKAFVAPLRAALRASDHPRILATLRPRAEPHDVSDQKCPGTRRAALSGQSHRPIRLNPRPCARPARRPPAWSKVATATSSKPASCKPALGGLKPARTPSASSAPTFAGMTMGPAHDFTSPYTHWRETWRSGLRLDFLRPRRRRSAGARAFFDRPARRCDP